jgi:hypothetical protein
MRVPESLRELDWELPHNFLGLDETASAFDRRRSSRRRVTSSCTIRNWTLSRTKLA